MMMFDWNHSVFPDEGDFVEVENFQGVTCFCHYRDGGFWNNGLSITAYRWRRLISLFEQYKYEVRNADQQTDSTETANPHAEEDIPGVQGDRFQGVA